MLWDRVLHMEWEHCIDLVFVRTYLVISKSCVQAKSLQESRAIARKQRDAAVVRCGLKFADIHYNSKSIAKLRKPAFRAIDIPAQNRI